MFSFKHLLVFLVLLGLLMQAGMAEPTDAESTPAATVSDITGTLPPCLHPPEGRPPWCLKTSDSIDVASTPVATDSEIAGMPHPCFWPPEKRPPGFPKCPKTSDSTAVDATPVGTVSDFAGPPAHKDPRCNVPIGPKRPGWCGWAPGSDSDILGGPSPVNDPRCRDPTPIDKRPRWCPKPAESSEEPLDIDLDIESSDMDEDEDEDLELGASEAADPGVLFDIEYGRTCSGMCHHHGRRPKCICHPPARKSCGCWHPNKPCKCSTK